MKSVSTQRRLWKKNALGSNSVAWGLKVGSADPTMDLWPTSQPSLHSYTHVDWFATLLPLLVHLILISIFSPYKIKQEEPHLIIKFEKWHDLWYLKGRSIIKCTSCICLCLWETYLDRKIILTKLLTNVIWFLAHDSCLFYSKCLEVYFWKCHKTIVSLTPQ